jgi:hypothetical protein
VGGLQEGDSGSAGGFELAAQRPEGGAETVAAGVGVAFGPEQFDERLPRMGIVRVKGQAGEQRGGFVGGEAGEGAPVEGEAQSAQHLYSAGGVHLVSSCSRERTTLPMALPSACGEARCRRGRLVSNFRAGKRSRSV